MPARTFARGCIAAVLLLTLVAGTARAEDDPPPGPDDNAQYLLDALARLIDVEGDLDLLARVALLWDPQLVALVQARQREAQIELGEAIAGVRRDGIVPARPDLDELLLDFDELKEQARRLRAQADEAERSGDSGSATRLRDEAATADLGAEIAQIGYQHARLVEQRASDLHRIMEIDALLADEGTGEGAGQADRAELVREVKDLSRRGTQIGELIETLLNRLRELVARASGAGPKGLDDEGTDAGPAHGKGTDDDVRARYRRALDRRAEKAAIAAAGAANEESRDKEIARQRERARAHDAEVTRLLGEADELTRAGRHEEAGRVQREVDSHRAARVLAKVIIETLGGKEEGAETDPAVPAAPASDVEAGPPAGGDGGGDGGTPPPEAPEAAPTPGGPDETGSARLDGAAVSAAIAGAGGGDQAPPAPPTPAAAEGVAAQPGRPTPALAGGLVGEHPGGDGPEPDPVRIEVQQPVAALPAFPARSGDEPKGLATLSGRLRPTVPSPSLGGPSLWVDLPSFEPEGAIDPAPGDGLGDLADIEAGIWRPEGAPVLEPDLLGHDQAEQRADDSPLDTAMDTPFDAPFDDPLDLGASIDAGGPDPRDELDLPPELRAAQCRAAC